VTYDHDTARGVIPKVAVELGYQGCGASVQWQGDAVQAEPRQRRRRSGYSPLLVPLPSPKKIKEKEYRQFKILATPPLYVEVSETCKKLTARWSTTTYISKASM
jgi:hypothetical protein